MSTRKFPQITRIYSALFGKDAGSAIILLLAVSLLVLNWQMSAKKYAVASSLFTSIEKTPFAPEPHIALARIFWENQLIDLAFKELVIADDLNGDLELHETNTRSNPKKPALDYLTLWKSEPEKIEKYYHYWEKLASDLGNYRDAHLIAGILAGQLGLSADSKAHFARAAQIDPNHPVVAETRTVSNR
jgi:hypothetical protein